MRKSAVSQDHYFVKWGDPYINDCMAILRDGPNHVSLSRAKKLIAKGFQSVAITRDIIISKNIGKSYPLYFRGMSAGDISGDVYIPSFSDNPLANRVRKQLEEV